MILTREEEEEDDRRRRRRRRLLLLLLLLFTKGEAENGAGCLGLRGFSHSRCCWRASLGEVRLFRDAPAKAVEKQDLGLPDAR